MYIKSVKTSQPSHSLCPCYLENLYTQEFQGKTLRESKQRQGRRHTAQQLFLWRAKKYEAHVAKNKKAPDICTEEGASQLLW